MLNAPNTPSSAQPMVNIVNQGKGKPQGRDAEQEQDRIIPAKVEIAEHFLQGGVRAEDAADHRPGPLQRGGDAQGAGEAKVFVPGRYQGDGDFPSQLLVRGGDVVVETVRPAELLIKSYFDLKP